MAIQLIFSEKININVESKFLLQALLCEEMAILGIPYKTKQAAKLLSLTERFVRFASIELVDAGLLVASKLTDRVGRPGLEYVASQYLLDLLAKTARSEYAHQDLILRLFTEPDIYAVGPASEKKPEADQEAKPARASVRKDGRPAAPGAYGRLGASSRMLLAALLSAADQCGAVTGLGESRLRVMTGMNAIALKHQMKRLINLGFIRSYVPGLSNAVFVGSKVSSIYYLNLDHPQLGGAQGSRGLVVYLTRGPGKFKALALGLPPGGEGVLKALGPEAIEMLYHKLANCTSHLLSLTLGAADGENDKAKAKAVIAEMIANELRELKIGKWEGMRENFLAAICEWAAKLQKRLLMEVWPGYTPELVRLIPAPNRKDDFRITSVIVYPAPQKQKACIVLRDIYKGPTELYDSEVELGAERRYEYGLLTAPT